MNESKMSKSECERATDYTLPPLPDHPFERSQWSNRERMALEVWGQQCAEAARAPLLALVAENARLREALRMMLRGTQEDCGRVCVPSDAAVRAAFAALAGAVHD